MPREGLPRCGGVLSCPRGPALWVRTLLKMMMSSVVAVRERMFAMSCHPPGEHIGLLDSSLASRLMNGNLWIRLLLGAVSHARPRSTLIKREPAVPDPCTRRPARQMSLSAQSFSRPWKPSTVFTSTGQRLGQCLSCSASLFACRPEGS